MKFFTNSLKKHRLFVFCLINDFNEKCRIKSVIAFRSICHIFFYQKIHSADTKIITNLRLMYLNISVSLMTSGGGGVWQLYQIAELPHVATGQDLSATN